MSSIDVGANQQVSIKIEFFSVTTNNPEDFIEELEALCEKFSPQEDVFFKYSFES